jgi:hypothetical protein
MINSRNINGANTAHKEMWPALSKQAIHQKSYSPVEPPHQPSLNASLPVGTSCSEGVLPPQPINTVDVNTSSDEKQQSVNAHTQSDIPSVKNAQSSDNTHSQHRVQQGYDTSDKAACNVNPQPANGTQSLTGIQPKNIPERISLGNVDILVNPEDDDN